MTNVPFTFLYGPTGSGKTAFALEWAQIHRGNILSADSRQIYQDFSFVVGKDLPENSVWHNETEAGKPAWQLPSGQFIWGLDIVPPTEVFTLSHWYTWAQPIIDWHRVNQVPLLIVGGTWQWLAVLIDPPESLFVPPDEAWRKEAHTFTLAELQKKLKENFPQHWSSLNNSDQNNARRLIRLWEVQNALSNHVPQSLISPTEHQILIRNVSLDEATANIWTRVLQRWESGALQETMHLMNAYKNWDTPAFTATGYESLRAYLEGSISQDQALEDWKNIERKYAKRQITWIRLIQKKHKTIEV